MPTPPRSRPFVLLDVLPFVFLCSACDPAPAVGQLVVLAPGVPVEFAVDGGESATVEKFKELELSVGEHAIVFSKPAERERSFTIRRGQKIVVPAIDNQCFVSLNVDASHYESAIVGGAPKFMFLEQSSQPFSPPGDHFFSESSLPKSRSNAQSTGLYVSGGCRDLIALEKKHKKAKAGG